MNNCSSSSFQNDSEDHQLLEYQDGKIEIPVNESSILGKVAISKQPIRVENAKIYPFHDQSIDVKTKFMTKSVLCLPIVDDNGVLYGVTQLLKPVSKILYPYFLIVLSFLEIFFHIKKRQREK